jgi:TetR/AcrR family transcriptional regulator, fatty acid metabolism regulator protein
MTTEISVRQFEIVEAAGKILTTSGVGGLTIKNLAKEMKFSESAIYRHFTSKEEIIVALLAYLAKNMDERYSLALSGDLSPQEKFVALFHSQFSYFNQNPHFVVAVFSDGLLEESQRINDTILEIMRVKIKHLVPIIIEGQKMKVFTSAIETNELVHIIMGTFRLQMYKWRVSNFQFEITKSGEQMIQSVLTLIKSKSN